MNPQDYKAAREALGTQEEVAELLGISRVTLARRETDALPINREAVLALEALRLARRPAAKKRPAPR